jgi:hypothetical protein
MNLSRLYLLVIFLTILSCNQKTESKKAPEIQNNIDSIKVNKPSKTTLTKVNNSQTNPRFEDFAKKILGNNLRKHDFKYLIENYKLYDLLPIDGLQDMVAFSDINYPKNSDPKYFQHFTLICYEYSTINQALNNFNTFYLTSQLNLNETDSIDESYIKKAKRIIGASKSGGLIVQQSNWIFHLVESCRDTPLGGSWIEYENEFLSFLKNKDDKFITILNADCGVLDYKKEDRAI